MFSIVKKRDGNNKLSSYEGIEEDFRKSVFWSLFTCMQYLYASMKHVTAT